MPDRRQSNSKSNLQVLGAQDAQEESRIGNVRALSAVDGREGMRGRNDGEERGWKE